MPEATAEKPTAAPETLPLWAARIEFKTPYPISDVTAQHFWLRGRDFSRKGAKEYAWHSEILALDLTTAIAYLTGEVVDIIGPREAFDAAAIEFVAADIGCIGTAPRG